jgi:hypothetical protein
VATTQRRIGDSTWKVREGWELTEMDVHGSAVGRRGNDGEEVKREVVGGDRVVEELCGTREVLEGVTVGLDGDRRRLSIAGCSVAEGRA